MKLPFFIGLIMCYQLMAAQVGIGTTAPTAQLELSSSIGNPNLPLLELNPQLSPAGSATGQLAVIGDQLYLYDATRAKWLSLNTAVLQWGYNGSADDVNLRTGGDAANTNSGVYMPFNGTIVHVTARSSGGNAAKGFEVRVRNGTTTNTTIPFNLAASTFSNTNYNVNFNAGDYLNVYAVAAGSGASDPVVTVWVKWRR